MGRTSLRVMRQHSPEQINLRLSTELKAALEAKCTELGIDRSAGARLAIQGWVNGVAPVTSAAPAAAPEGYEEVLSALVAKIAAIEDEMAIRMSWRESVEEWMRDGNQRLAVLEGKAATPEAKAPSIDRTSDRMAELLSKLQK